MANKPRSEQHRGVTYTLIVSREGKGFIAQAAIWHDGGGNPTISQVIGSADVILPTRKDAEQAARVLAQKWIDGQQIEREAQPGHSASEVDR